MKLYPLKSRKPLSEYSGKMQGIDRILYTYLLEYLEKEITATEISKKQFDLFEKDVRESFNRLRKIGIIVQRDGKYLLRCFVPKFPNKKKKKVSSDVIHIIHTWEKTNPAAKLWYTNTTFQNDIQILIDKIGIDQLKVIVYAFIPFGNKAEFTYVPKIETPRKLIEKITTYREDLEKAGVFKKYKAEMDARIKELNL